MTAEDDRIKGSRTRKRATRRAVSEAKESKPFYEVSGNITLAVQFEITIELDQEITEALQIRFN